MSRWVLIIGVPMLVGGVVVAIGAYRTQQALLASGQRLDTDLRLLGRATDTQLRAQAQRWAGEIRDYYVRERVPTFVRAQAEPALIEMGVSPSLLRQMASVARYA